MKITFFYVHVLRTFWFIVSHLLITRVMSSRDMVPRFSGVTTPRHKFQSIFKTVISIINGKLKEKFHIFIEKKNYPLYTTEKFWDAWRPKSSLALDRSKRTSRRHPLLQNGATKRRVRRTAVPTRFTASSSAAAAVRTGCGRGRFRPGLARGS